MQVKMGRANLTLLCLWSCIITVTALTETQVHTATKYITNTFNLVPTRQYAYVAVFSKQECDSLSSDNNNVQILKNENAKLITSALTDTEDIYPGSQMVLATYGDHGFHAEYRLLFPKAGSNVSPVEDLVNKNPDAVCAIFYSLKTPCVGICTNTSNNRNIIQKLSVFNKYENNKAFVYTQIYSGNISQQIGKEDIWNGLKKMNDKMDVYRCFPSKCLKCFEKEKNKGHCIN